MPSVRAAAVIASWSRQKVSVGLSAARAGGDADEGFGLAAEDLRDARVDLAAGLVVAPAEAALHARERVLGLGQRALSGGGDLALLLGGVDVGDAQRECRAGLGVGDLPVAQRAAVARAQRRGQVVLALGDVAERPQRPRADVLEVALAEARRGSQRHDEAKARARDLRERLGVPAGGVADDQSGRPGELLQALQRGADQRDLGGVAGIGPHVEQTRRRRWWPAAL